MRSRVLAMLFAAVALATVLPALPAHAATGCGALRQEFPTGIAISTKRASLAYDRLWRKPQVAREAYMAQRHLDLAGRGYLCTIRPTRKVPLPARNVSVVPVASSPDGSPTLLVTWESNGRAWPQPVSYTVLVNGSPPQGDVTATFGGGNYALMLSDLMPMTRYEITVFVSNSSGQSRPVGAVATTF